MCVFSAPDVMTVHTELEHQQTGVYSSDTEGHCFFYGPRIDEQSKAKPYQVGAAGARRLRAV